MSAPIGIDLYEKAYFQIDPATGKPRIVMELSDRDPAKLIAYFQSTPVTGFIMIVEIGREDCEDFVRKGTEYLAMKKAKEEGATAATTAANAASTAASASASKTSEVNENKRAAKETSPEESVATKDKPAAGAADHKESQQN